MKHRRISAIFALELRGMLRRPMFWSLIGVVGLLAWGMSTGSVQLGTGTAFVGGKKAWITSEFTNAFILSIVAATFYSFFTTIATGLSVIADDETKIAELLRSTRLSAGEYVWGKVSAYLVAFSLALVANLAFMILFNHVVPNPQAEEIRGPLHLWHYLRPALVFSLPTLIFFAGTAFYLGARFRRPAPVLLLPVGLLLVEGTLLWNFSPTWLNPQLNRLLMLLDPSGFRWLNETWLKLDRGVDFYNRELVGLDTVAVANRLAFLGLGLAGVWLAQRHLAKVFRGAHLTVPRRRQPKAVRQVPPGDASAWRPTPPRFLPTVWAFARMEAGILWREPALYIFVAFVLVQTLTNSLVQLGAFQTPVLLTSGQFAAGTFNTLSLLVSLLVMFFLVESLERESGHGTSPLIYGSPAPTAALVVGKALGSSLIGLAVLFFTFLGGALTMAIQGQVTLTFAPFFWVWGLLLLPTFLAWTAFVATLWGLLGRYTTYALSLGLVAVTLYRQLTEGLSWFSNWLIWGTVRWSDLSLLELDRRAFVLNRLMILSLAVLLLMLAVRSFPRRRPDVTQLIHLFSFRALSTWWVPRARGLAPFATVAAVLAGLLWFGVLHGHDGETAQEELKDYWQQNLNTWKDRPQPSLVSVDLNVDLEPAQSWFHTRGTYELVNHHDQPLEQFALTGGRHWQNVGWTLSSGVGGGDGVRSPAEASRNEVAKSYDPEERNHLYVFTPQTPLAPGDRVTVGFDYSGRYPDGMSEQGGERREFILPSSVVLTGFTPSFAPVLGYNEEVGVDDDNRADPPAYVRNRHEEVLPPLFGNQTPFRTRIQVTAPQELTVNSVGSLESETSAEGRRTVVWVSDHPVRMFNIVAGRWQVRRGAGTAVFYHPQHAYNVDEISHALEAARKHYSQWFYPYPWAELKLSEFAALAGYAQGFPTNITFSEALGFLTRSDPRSNPVLLVTAHEAAHQWWGNLLTPGDGPGGALLSEAMAHFSTALLMEELGGPQRRMEFTKRLEERYGDRRYKDAERPLVQVDFSRRGDETVTYDKGGWVFWMLMQQIGRENLLAGLRQFIVQRMAGPDYPLLEDLIETLRPYAPEPEAFDRFVDEWFYHVVVPEYRLSHPRVSPPSGAQGGWEVSVEVENHGTGRLPVEIAAVTGRRFDEEGAQNPEYRDSRTTVILAAGESRRVRWSADFEPQRLVVDPDISVLQLRRNAAVAEL